MYEKAQKSFKEDYNLTSKCLVTVMRESIHIPEDRILLRTDGQVKYGLATRRVNPIRVRDVSSYGALMVNRGQTFTIEDIETAHVKLADRNREQGLKRAPCDKIESFVRSINSDSVASHLYILCGLFTLFKASSNEVRHLKIQLTASAFISRYYPPKFSDAHQGASLFMRKTSLRASQRVVPKAQISRCEWSV